jgi:tRNA(fMet)-specific endonuclease VapC
LAYLFDTDALSEVFKPRPARSYVEWLGSVHRSDQFTSAVVMGELYRGAFRSPQSERHLQNIESRVRPAITVLAYDVATARVYGRMRAHLEGLGTMLADADLQIAATALQYELELVTGNLKHFRRVPGLRVNAVLANARGPGS